MKKVIITCILGILFSVITTGFINYINVSAASNSSTSSTSSTSSDNKIDFNKTQKDFINDLRNNGLNTQASQYLELPENVRMSILVKYINDGYKTALSELLSQIETYSNMDTGNPISDTQSKILNACGFGFNVVKDLLEKSKTKYFEIPSSIVDSIINVLIPFAYAFVVICICINMSKKTMQFELFTARGAVSLFGQIFIAKVLIDASDKILVDIVNLNNNIVDHILNHMGYTTSINLSSFTINTINSRIPIIGSLMTLILTLTGGILLLIVSLILLICAWIMIIKLGIRAVEIVMLRCVAPIFLSTLASSETSDIGKNFIRTFISTVIQTLFISIAYVLMVSIINSTFAAAGNGTDFNLVMLCGVYVMTLTFFVIKTPRMLNQILIR